jgi:hypothetical protein
MPLIGTLTRREEFFRANVLSQSAVLDAAGEFTGNVSVNKRAVVDVQFQVTGAPTSAIVVIENSLDGGSNWVEVSAGTNRTANGFYKETFTGLCGQVRANLKTLTGGTSPTIANLVIGVSSID